ncbi:glycosyltransferase [Vibrio parahaemolyticus]|nr:glycosyltransferase [Vibrio parahaemolyticus]
MDRIQCHFISTIIFSLPSLVVFSKKTSIVIEGLGSFCDSNKEVLKVLKFIFINFKFNRVFMNVDERNQLGKTTDTVLGGIGIDLEQYKLKLSPKNELETPRNNALSIAYAGRLLKDKGINDVFKLLDICIENNIDVMLNVYGDIYKNNPSSLTQSDIEYLSEHFGEKVKFWGYCENLKESLVQNDLLVLPSKREGFPVVVMEASALGIPTIAYNVPGSQDAIINEVNGFLSPYGDVDELYRHVRYFVSLPDIEKEKLSLSAKKYAEDNFSRTIKNRDLYNSVLRK